MTLDYVNPDERKRVRRGIKAHSRILQKYKRLAGQRFGMLTVVERYCGPYWLCRCDCGKEVMPHGGNLKSGNTKSCGCQRWTPEQQRAALRARWDRPGRPLGKRHLRAKQWSPEHRAKLSAAAKRRWAKPCHPSLSAE